MNHVRLADLDLTGRTVVMRVDFNSPIDTSCPKITDFGRINDHLDKTVIQLFAGQRPPRNVVLLAHQGRPGQDDCTTLRLHFEHCRSRLLEHGIKTFYVWEEYDDEDVLAMKGEAVSGNEVLQRIKRLQSVSERSVLLLENVRFSEAEEPSNGRHVESFANAPLIEMLKNVENAIFALDGFSVAHRAQASVVGLALLGPVYAGNVMLREIEQLSTALQRPEEPTVLIVGGGKVDDSLQSVERFLSAGQTHKVLTGGLLGMVFLLGNKVKLNQATLSNLHQTTRDLDKTVGRCKALLERWPSSIEVPMDLACVQGAHRHNLSLNSSPLVTSVTEEFGDIGIQTIGRYVGEISRARTIIMNGPMGRYEKLLMALGTREILRYAALVAHDTHATALIGGGDTSAALSIPGIDYSESVRQCSSGKAFLEVLASGNVESLVGVRVLERKDHAARRLALV